MSSRKRRRTIFEQLRMVSQPCIIRTDLPQPGQPWTPQLLSIVEDPFRPLEARRAAMEMLQRLPDRNVATAIVQVLAREPELAFDAAKVLAATGSRRVTRRLLAVARLSPDHRIRQAAIWALSLLHDKRSTQTLISILRNSKEPPSVRAEAAHALAGRKSALPALVESSRDPSADVRFSVAYALGESGDHRALPALIALSRDTEAPVGGRPICDEAGEAIETIRSVSKLPLA